MNIDERKEIFDLSDHCMLTTKLNLYTQNRKYKKNNHVYTEYYKTNDTTLKNVFLDALEKDIINRKHADMQPLHRLETIMKENADNIKQ